MSGDKKRAAVYPPVENPTLEQFIAKLEERKEPLELIVSEEMHEGWRARHDLLIFPAELLKLITDVLEGDASGEI